MTVAQWKGVKRRSETIDTMVSSPHGAMLAVGDLPWTEARREEVRAQVRAGTLDALEFRAAVYRTGRNANHVRFREEDLPQLAASFVGVPFLRNHQTEDIDARDGVVVASALVGPEIHQTIRLTTQRGMRSFVEGVIDRFSIAWHFSKVECSVCGEDWLKCPHWPGQEYDGRRCELVFREPVGKETSAVNVPAVQGTRILAQMARLKEEGQMTEEAEMSEEKVIYLPDGTAHMVEHATLTQENLTPPLSLGRGSRDGEGQVQGQGNVDEAAAVVAEARALLAQIEAREREAEISSSGLSNAGQAAVRLAAEGRDRSGLAALIEAQRAVEAEQVDAQVVKGIRPIVASMMQTPQDRVQASMDWIFGLRSEQVPPPSLRSIRDLYLAITGDHNWYGVFSPEWSQLAAASTTTLAGLVVNSLNKVVRMHYDNLATYRWYEQIVDVTPHDGSTQSIDLLMVDGLANLPTVGEGAAYTEALVGDSKESMSFTKRGHYVGITLEAIRRSDIQRIQAIPREMVKASIRTRSAAIAGIFTQASGAGPTLADDSTALFHANHGNLDTTAFSATAWAGARQRIWSQTVPGTANPFGLWPTFCLVPIELYDAALEAFGYGSGDVGKPNTGGTAQTVNPYALSRAGDPRPVPVAVPEWTDATDWAYIVDPRIHPVISMAYANAPQGGEHPLPEIFEVTSETSGLIFTNDTLPVKIRDWWGYGVATYVGVGKNNVAGG